MENKRFEDLDIIPPIMRAIKEQNYTEPTDIQVETIPLVAQGKDVIGGSKTGSGKTLAFASGIIQNTVRGQGVQALVLVPTRELAEQVAESFITFSKYVGLKIEKVYGGVSINPQIDHLPDADIVIGTPGRILDHLSRNTIDLSRLRTLVLDEADMMLDMGFLPDVERILAQTPQDRQTLLFSATISSDIHDLTDKHMKDPIRVSMEEFVDPTKLDQVYYSVPNRKKLSLLVHLIKKEQSGLIMVFCNTREHTDLIAKNLKMNGINSHAIHGGLTQNKRNNVLDNFHKGNVFVLICTDVAARGLDIKGVTHVYNYDTCRDPKQYIHRIGRTARAGKDGKAITLLSDRDHDNFRRLLQVNDVLIKEEELPELEEIKSDFSSISRGRGPRRDINRPGDRRFADRRSGVRENGQRRRQPLGRGETFGVTLQNSDQRDWRERGRRGGGSRGQSEQRSGNGSFKRPWKGPRRDSQKSS